jgi:hypothetical protein
MAAADDPTRPVSPPPDTPPANKPDVPLWRQLADWMGVDQEVDAAGDVAGRLGAWIRSLQPEASPAAQARPPVEADMAAWMAKRKQASRAAVAPVLGPIKRVLGSAAQGIGQQFAEDYAPAFRQDPGIKSAARVAHEALTERTAPGREAMARAGVPAPLQAVIGAQTDWLPGLALDTVADASTPFGALSNVDLPVGPALKAAAPFVGGAAAHLAGVLPPGFFSRVDRVAEQVGKKGIHPNKLASLLKSGASSEEVAYRGLPEFLAAKGNQLISKEELAAHLAANPPPIPETVVRGERPARKSFEEFVQAYNGPGRKPVPADQLRPAYESYVAQPHPDFKPTKYKDYTLPGGEQYRETLLTLPQRGEAGFQKLVAEREAVDGEIKAFHDARGEDRFAPHPPELVERFNRLQAQINAAPHAQYQSGHWDEPNILTHIRSTERQLPAQTRSLPEIEAIIQDVVGARHPEHIASGGPQMAVAQGLITHDEAAAYGRSRGFTNYPHDPGERGRFIEEIQSDWHQAGKRSGYAQVTPEMQAQAEKMRGELAAANALSEEKYAALDVAHNAYLDLLGAHARQHLPPEFAHLTGLDQAVREGSAATAAWRGARDVAMTIPEVRAAQQASQLTDTVHTRAVNRVNHLTTQLRALESPTGVPDAPFKETWPDLALKQQLLDVAHRRDLSWLGATSGQTQNERYDLAKQVSSVRFEPEDAGDYSLGTLVAHDHEGNEVLRENRLEPHELDQYIGKEPADKLRREIASKEHEASQWSVMQDPGDGYWYVVDPNGEYVGGDHAATEQGAERALQQIRSGDWYHDADGRHAEISGLDLQVGGEGMTSFYDQLLPARLNKLLKPFGGSVERGGVPVTKMVTEPQLGFAVLDARDREIAWNATREGAEAFLAGAPSAGGVRIVDRQRLLPVDRVVDEPAWIAHLSDDMKERIRQQGFSLMSFLPPALAGAGAAAAQLTGGGDQDQPGRPQHWLGASFLPDRSGS